ncbi:MAG: FAD-dependent oxidoreductase [Schleiferiaceae bacterium]
MSKHFNIVVIGAGTAGIMTAAQIKNERKNLTIAIVDPADTHYYQAAWTLVGGGTYDKKKTGRPMSSVIPSGCEWVKDFVTTIDADNNTVETKATGALSYDYLIAAPGIQLDTDGIPGLKEGLEKGIVCSNYTDPEKVWENVQNFKGGNAIFTQPTTPIKCGGAPQKIMYLADDYWAKTGVKAKTKVVFPTPGSVIFGVPEFAKTLNQVIHRKGIHFKPFYAITKIDIDKKEVHFKNAKPGENDCTINEGEGLGERLDGNSTFVLPFDFLHLAPPQSAPDFIKNSPLSNGTPGGWIDVDINTLQHNKYPNVFALGDSAALPTAKTGAAIRKQAPVVAANVLSLIKLSALSDKKYEGYSSCPLVTGYGKMVLAEFKYNNVRDSDPFLSKFVDTTKENYSMWILKKFGLPFMYWNYMMKGKM